ncbi:MAG: type IV pili methyl-accepting chemotaxis transducer N-terminal domain-containing protein [Gemmatimonadetes bacterium]|nr:type IV pili methyl-accepting chemotaxis transducer N-terminal domain-containing protein [Gemmatimonadota bacterium]
MRHLSLRFTLGLVLVDVALVGGLLVATSLWNTRAQRHDALIINLTGLQRMLSQKMAKEAALGLVKGDGPRYVEQMHATAHEFAVDLRALIQGGPAQYMGTLVWLPPAEDPEFLAALERVQADWEPLHRAAHAVLESEPASPAFQQGVADLERLSGAILTKVDAAVRVYEAAAEARVSRLELAQLGFLAAGALVLLLSYALIVQRVLRPVRALEAAASRIAAGDLDSAVDVRVGNELGRLGEVLEGMRRAVKQRGEVATLESRG